MYQYHFTKNQSEINDYYKVRNQLYHDELHLKFDFTKEDKYDRNSKILVIKHDINHEVKVIGGVRVVISCQQDKLPLEKEGFLIQDIFPDFDINKHRYCEVGRVAILPEFRSMEVVREIFNYLVKYGQNRCEYIFALAMKNHCRLYRRILNSLGVNLTIYDNIKVPHESKYQELTSELILLSIQLNQTRGEIKTKKTYENA